jgi:predicted amidohydrolase
MPNLQSTVRVAAVQMKMRWYEDAADFAQAIDAHTKAARDLGAQLIVFPEDVGLPLLALGDLDIARASARSDQFALRMIARHFPRFIATAISRRCSLRRALLLLKAPALREAYFRAFSAAARRHDAYIVGGSLPLPPEDTHEARVFNVSGVFAPDGTCLGLARKVGLIALECDALHLSHGRVEDLPVFEAPFGRFGVAVCLDNWNAELVADLHRRGAEIICDPAANPKRWDEGEQASNKAGLWTRCQEQPVFGIQAAGVGTWLDLNFEGQSSIVGPRELTPDGSGYLAVARTCDEEEIVVADLDMAALRANRR